MNENSDSFSGCPSLDDAEAVLADVGILRREGDEALLGQPRGEGVIERDDPGRIGDVGGRPSSPCWQTTTGAPLARPDVLRHQQHAVGEDLGPDVQHHFVAAELRRVVDQPRARIGRQAWDRAGGRSLRPRCSRDRTSCDSRHRSGDDASAFAQNCSRLRGDSRTSFCVYATSSSNCCSRRRSGIAAARLRPDFGSRFAPSRGAAPPHPWPSFTATFRCARAASERT